MRTHHHPDGGTVVIYTCPDCGTQRVTGRGHTGSGTIVARCRLADLDPASHWAYTHDVTA